MGIFWLFVEGLIMLYVRKGVFYLEKGDSRQRIFLLTCIIPFILLAVLNYGHELGFIRIFHITSRPLKNYYYSFLWNIFCTLWVVIEGAGVIYVFRIYNIFRKILENKKPILRKTLSYGPGIFCLTFLAFYTAYHLYLGSLVSDPAFTHKNIQNIFRFYIKICGVFWILIEWLVGLIVLKIFILFNKRRKENVS